MNDARLSMALAQVSAEWQTIDKMAVMRILMAKNEDVSPVL